MHHPLRTERAPFIKGREPVVLTAKELREMNSRVGIADRNMACIEAVLVKRLPYCEAGKLLKEKPSYVRGAYLWGLKRLGLTGEKAFEGDVLNRLIIENVPPQFHALLTAKVLETVPKLLAQEAAAKWQGPASEGNPQPVPTQTALPQQTDVHNVT